MIAFQSRRKNLSTYRHHRNVKDISKNKRTVKDRYWVQGIAQARKECGLWRLDESLHHSIDHQRGQRIQQSLRYHYGPRLVAADQVDPSHENRIEG